MRNTLDFTYPHPALEAELLAIAQQRPFFSVDALLVVPEFQGRGLGWRLREHTLSALYRQGPGVVLSEIWIYPDGSAPGKKVLERLGNPIFYRKEEHFYRDFRRYGMRCPICGPDCVCGAWIVLGEFPP